MVKIKYKKKNNSKVFISRLEFFLTVFFSGKILLLFLTGQFLLISGKAIVKRQVEQIPAVANPAIASATNSVGEPGAVDTSERFGLLGRLIAKHRMRQAIKHGMIPMNPGFGMGPGFMGWNGTQSITTISWQ